MREQKRFAKLERISCHLVGKCIICGVTLESNLYFSVSFGISPSAYWSSRASFLAPAHRPSSFLVLRESAKKQQLHKNTSLRFNVDTSFNQFLQFGLISPIFHKQTKIKGLFKSHFVFVCFYFEGL